MTAQTNWTSQKIKQIYDQPLIHLISQAHEIHRQHHPLGEIQVCHLISIKTGGCPEDCKYCAQSSRYQTSVKATPMLDRAAVLAQAQHAINQGATRVCLGAAWRNVRDSKQFEEILVMIQEIAAQGVEVCCTLGMITSDQARRLKEAGLTAYNHNLDTSESYYGEIITTRTYADRLRTLDIVEEVKLSVCCGGIIGLGESIQDRLDLIRTLCNRNPQPESVPINCLSAIPGTPFEHQPKVSVWELVRMIALARITMPKSMVRLSAGRIDLNHEQHALCFMAGANSIFAGEKLLTVANHNIDRDEELFRLLGLQKRKSYLTESPCCTI